MPVARSRGLTLELELATRCSGECGRLIPHRGDRTHDPIRSSPLRGTRLPSLDRLTQRETRPRHAPVGGKAGRRVCRHRSASRRSTAQLTFRFGVCRSLSRDAVAKRSGARRRHAPGNGRSRCAGASMRGFMTQMREDKPGRADCDTKQQSNANQAGRARFGGRRRDAHSGAVFVVPVDFRPVDFRPVDLRPVDLRPVLGRAGILRLVEVPRVRRDVFLGEVLLLAIHAIDLTGRPVKKAHLPLPRQATRATQATGSKDGEKSRSRPLTRGWEAPVDRLGNRSPASLGTRLC